MTHLEQMINQMKAVEANAKVHEQQAMINDEYWETLLQNADEKQKEQIQQARVKVQRVINLAKRGDGSHIKGIQDLMKEYAHKGNK